MREVSRVFVNVPCCPYSSMLLYIKTERVRIEKNGIETNITRLISARLATSFVRGIYYGKYE